MQRLFACWLRSRGLAIALIAREVPIYRNPEQIAALLHGSKTYIRRFNRRSVIEIIWVLQELSPNCQPGVIFCVMSGGQTDSER